LPPPILYLDVDGILLGEDSQGGYGVTLAKHAEEFLSYSTAHYDCHWLTTHCRDGDTGPLMRYLARFADQNVLALAAAVKPTVWCTLKTEAIDLASDFYVIDDGLLQVEQELLARHGLLKRWIQADTRRRPDDLRRVLGLLRLLALAPCLWL